MIKEQVGIIEYYFDNAILVMLSSFQQPFSPMTIPRGYPNFWPKAFLEHSIVIGDSTKQEALNETTHDIGGGLLFGSLSLIFF